MVAPFVTRLHCLTILIVLDSYVLFITIPISLLVMSGIPMVHKAVFI